MSAPARPSVYDLRSLDGDALPQHADDGGCERITFSGTYEIGPASWTSTTELAGSCFGKDSARRVRHYAGTYTTQGDTLTLVSHDSIHGTLEMGRALLRQDTLRYAGPGLSDGPTEIYLKRR